jgi:multicomponent Na+:H+ antiporter subunit D
MAEMLSGVSGRRPDVVRHRDHVHVGAGTYGVSDRNEARSIIDEDDSTNEDLYQLTAKGALPTRSPRTMVGATGCLVALSLGLTILAGPLFAYTDQAAQDILHPQRYVSAVLPEELR